MPKPDEMQAEFYHCYLRAWRAAVRETNDKRKAELAEKAAFWWSQLTDETKAVTRRAAKV